MSRRFRAEAESSIYSRSQIPRKISSPPVTQQFGVSLLYIRNLNVAMVNLIPPVVRDCVEYLSRSAGLETEGIFRLTANPWVIKELKYLYNRGYQINFGKRTHVAATVLITFFHDLAEPIFTYKLYNVIIHWTFGCFANRPRKVKSIIDRLPVENYIVLKYLIRFLLKVNERSSVNEMDIDVLAFVFGPILARPRVGDRLIQDIVRINSFFAYLLVNFQTIFTY